ncbi:MAG: DUF1214 domain-containing protein [Bauldia sp.]
MRFLIDIAIAILIATTIGFFTAWYAVEYGGQYGAVAVGEWTSWPGAGSPNADPYAVALLARTGEVPLGAGEGTAFSAEKDDSGSPLTGRCAYLIAGQTPAARLWTLTGYDANGRLMANAARRSSFHSREIVRRPDGGIEIAVSTIPSPGNWLPIARVDRFKLVFRFYDTPLTAGGGGGDIVMPKITRSGCQ